MAAISISQSLSTGTKLGRYESRPKIGEGRIGERVATKIDELETSIN